VWRLLRLHVIVVVPRAIRAGNDRKEVWHKSTKPTPRVTPAVRVLVAVMKSDRMQLSGARNVPNVHRNAVRRSATPTNVVLGGQCIAITADGTRVGSPSLTQGLEVRGNVRH
jgi:hypothetical protein